MRTYYIYLVTDKTNGKHYVGQTCDPKSRKWQHESNRKEDDCLFHRALESHGHENFIWEIICKTTTKVMANALEKMFIQVYNSYKPNGYNMTKGGDGGSMWNARPVVCLTLNGKFVKRYDSAGEAQRIDGFWNSNVLESCKNENLTCLGYMFMFEDEYQKYGARKYKKNRAYNVRKIIQCDQEGNFIEAFDSVVDAAEKTGVRRSTISANLIGTYKHAGGYIFVYAENFPIKDIEKYRCRKKGVPVQQRDVKTNEVIAEYDRIADAGRALGKNYKAIHKVVDNPDKTAYGFRWTSKSIC